jgi:hypothetical protein
MNKYSLSLVMVITIVLSSLLLSQIALAAPLSLKELNPLKGLEDPKDLPNFIGGIIKTVLGVTGAIALVMFIYGGMTLLTSAGVDTAIRKGKDIIIWASIGIVMIFSSYIILNFIIIAITTVKK